MAEGKWADGAGRSRAEVEHNIAPTGKKKKNLKV